MADKVVNTQTGVQILVSGQGLRGPPGPSGSGGDVEDLSTQGAVGSVPTSDGGGGLVMSVPSGSGNVISPGGETPGLVTKFTGSGTIDATVTTETQLATAVTHSGVVTGNPHTVTAAQAGAEPAGAIATHAALSDVHHAELHTAESHTGQESTGAQVDAAVTHSTTVVGNPHSLNAADVGAEASGAIATHAALANVHHSEAHAFAGAEHSTSTLATVNTKISDATLDTSSASRPPSGSASGDLSSSFPGPTVSGLQGQAVSGTTPTEGQVLVSTSNVWTPADPSGGGGPGSDTTAIHRDENNEFDSISYDATPPTDGRIIAETAAGVKFRTNIGDFPTGGGGEANSLVNAGTGITGVATPAKVGINLQARGHAAASSKMIVSEDAPNENVTYDVDDSELTLATLNSGFEDRTDVTISKVDGTRTFTVTPTGGDYNIRVAGVMIAISGTHNVVWPDTVGTKRFQFNSSGVLTTENGPSISSDSFDRAAVAVIYWDAASGITRAFADDRHEWYMSAATRAYMHDVFAAQWLSGLALTILSIDGSGDDLINVQTSMSSGVFRDEDLEHNVVDGSPQTLSPEMICQVFWIEGTDVAPVLKSRATNTTIPFLSDNDAEWTGRVPFNEFTGSVWQLTETVNNDYVLVHGFASSGVASPVFTVQGQATYANIAAAQAGAGSELNVLLLLGLGTKETVPLFTFILQTSNTHSNVAESRIVATLTGDYVDWRQSPRVGIGGVSVNQHDALANRELLSNHSLYMDHGGTRPWSGDTDHGGFAITNVGLVDGVDVGAHVADLANPHATDIDNLGSGTLAELNSAVTDANLDDASDPRDPNAHDLSGADHNSSTAAAFNAKITDANFDDAGDSRPPDSHAFAGAEHSTSNLAAVNSKITDATLDTSSASRPPNGSASGDLSSSYPGPTVAGLQGQTISGTTPTEGQVLTSISSVWTPTAAAGGAPTGSAGGDLASTYPNPEVAAITTTTGPTSLVIGAVADGEFLKRDGSTLVGDTPAGGGGGITPYAWSAIELWSSNTADWDVNGNAPLAQDSNNSMLTVRLSDDATEQGFGQEFTVRSSAASMQVITISRAETAPGGAVVAKPLIRFRKVAVNGTPVAVGSWGSPIALTDIDFGTNEFFARYDTDDTLTNWGLDTDDTYQFQITRTPTGDTLTGDLAWKRIEFTFT